MDGVSKDWRYEARESVVRGFENDAHLKFTWKLRFDTKDLEYPQKASRKPRARHFLLPRGDCIHVQRAAIKLPIHLGNGRIARLVKIDEH
jgi:hypothetical protein